MLSQTTKTHSTPLGGSKPLKLLEMVAGARFELATFRVYDPVYISGTYNVYPWLGRY
jgi:hypothetical protein